MSRKKILFMSHAVTMAHVARPLKWIESLDHQHYEIFFGCSADYRAITPEHVTYIKTSGLDPKKFAEIVDKAGIMYDSKTFEDHIQEDMDLIEQVRPDLVIGDFRHSLSVSCRLKKVKYVNMSNAYWSPYTETPYPLPESPIIRLFGEKLSGVFLKPFIPFVLKLNFFLMVFEIRKALGKVRLKFHDYRQIITDGDLTLFFDTPTIVPLKKRQAHERFMGPLVWSMPVPLPIWWTQLSPTRKRVFVALGSSGQAGSLLPILNVLSQLDVDILLSMSGKKVTLPSYPSLFVTDFLPIEDACKNSNLVICNGGSPMTHAALSYGVPTLGIIGNNDQLLNMNHIQKKGAGRTLRYWSLTEQNIKHSCKELLNNPSYLKSAQDIQKEFSAIDLNKNFQDIFLECGMNT